MGYHYYYLVLALDQLRPFDLERSLLASRHILSEWNGSNAGRAGKRVNANPQSPNILRESSDLVFFVSSEISRSSRSGISRVRISVGCFFLWMSMCHGGVWLLLPQRPKPYWYLFLLFSRHLLRVFLGSKRVRTAATKARGLSWGRGLFEGRSLANDPEIRRPRELGKKKKSDGNRRRKRGRSQYHYLELEFSTLYWW